MTYSPTDGLIIQLEHYLCKKVKEALDFLCSHITSKVYNKMNLWIYIFAEV